MEEIIFSIVIAVLGTITAIAIYLAYQLSKSTNENKYPEQTEESDSETEVTDHIL